MFYLNPGRSLAAGQGAHSARHHVTPSPVWENHYITTLALFSLMISTLRNVAV